MSAFSACSTSPVRASITKAACGAAAGRPGAASVAHRASSRTAMMAGARGVCRGKAFSVADSPPAPSLPAPPCHRVDAAGPIAPKGGRRGGRRRRAMAEENVRVVLARRPEDVPQRDDFAVETAPVPEPGPGEFVARLDWWSADPAQRGWALDVPNYLPP